LMNRDHYRLVCEIESLDTSVSEMDRSIKRSDTIVKAIGSSVTHVYRPKRPEWYKSVANDELILVDDESRLQIRYLSSYSALIKSINIGSQLFVYADKVDAKNAKALYEEFLNNEAKEARSAEKALKEAQDNASLISRVAKDGVAPGAQLEIPPLEVGKTVQPEILTHKGVPNVG